MPPSYSRLPMIEGLRNLRAGLETAYRNRGWVEQAPEPICWQFRSNDKGELPWELDLWKPLHRFMTGAAVPLTRSKADSAVQQFVPNLLQEHFFLFVIIRISVSIPLCSSAIHRPFFCKVFYVGSSGGERAGRAGGEC